MSAAARVAVVTGAGGGLGTAIAARLGVDGYSIAAIDIDGAAAASCGAAIEAAGGSAAAIEADLGDADEIDAAFAAARALGPIGLLVNNAAVFPVGPFLDVPVAEVDETIRVNQRAYFLCAQRAAADMVDRGAGGAIVNVASITWHGGWPDMSVYVMTKGAIVTMTRVLARELGAYDIRVNAVAPGAFPTAAERAQHPDLGAYEARILDSQALKRRGHNEELAAVVSFLAGDQASFVTGQTLNVDGGWIMT